MYYNKGVNSRIGLRIKALLSSPITLRAIQVYLVKSESADGVIVKTLVLPNVSNSPSSSALSALVHENWAAGSPNAEQFNLVG